MRAISHWETRARAPAWSVPPRHFPGFRWETFWWETRFHFPTLSSLTPRSRRFLLHYCYLQ